MSRPVKCHSTKDDPFSGNFNVGCVQKNDGIVLIALLLQWDYPKNPNAFHTMISHGEFYWPNFSSASHCIEHQASEGNWDFITASARHRESSDICATAKQQHFPIWPAIHLSCYLRLINFKSEIMKPFAGTFDRHKKPKRRFASRCVVASWIGNEFQWRIHKFDHCLNYMFMFMGHVYVIAFIWKLFDKRVAWRYATFSSAAVHCICIL